MSANGLYAMYPNVIELGDLTPEFKVITVERPNPHKRKPADPDTVKVPLRGYVNGTRTLLSRAAAFSAARKAWLDALIIRDDNGEPVIDKESGRPQQDADEDGRIWTIFVMSALMAVTTGPDGGGDGLTQDEALVLAFNGNRGVRLLEDWGWFPKPSEDAPDPEAQGEGSPTTGGSSSPISATTSTAVEPT